MPVGYHVGGGHNLHHAGYRAQSWGLPALQTFLNTPLRIEPKSASDEEIEIFVKSTENIEVFFHAPYVMNPSGPHSPKDRARIVGTLKRSMILSGKLMARGFVIHPGSFKEGSIEEGERRLLSIIQEVFEDVNVRKYVNHGSWSTKLLLENDTGNGTKVGGDLFGLSNFIRHQVGDERHVGLALDTAHVFGAGTDLRDSEIRKYFFEGFSPWASMTDPNAEFQYLLPDVVHFNNPNADVEPGSGKDRHKASLDGGAIELEVMKEIYHFFTEKGVSCIIEGSPDPEYDSNIVKYWDGER